MSYNNLIKIIHYKVPSYIPFFIMQKYHFTNNIFFHMLSNFLRFNCLLLLCANFSLKLSELESKSLSYYLRFLTSKKLMEILNITNTNYIIISLIIFFLFCLRTGFYFLIIRLLKKQRYLSPLYLFIYQIINFMEHIVYLIYPFLLGFLVQILYLYIFPDTFLFKIDASKIINAIIAIINSLLIIGYNINNYFFMKIINRPYDDKNTSIKFRYSTRKFWIIFLLQNIALIQSIPTYLYTDEQLEIFSYIYLCLFCLIFLALFLISLQKFNYYNITNSFISIMASFCFFSVIIKCFCSVCGYAFKDTYTIISMNILKVVISFYFNELINFIGNNILFKSAMKELFKINKEGTKESVYDSFLYMMNILKKLKNNNKDTSTVLLLNSILQHQNQCSLSNCKCKLIQIIPHGKQYNENYTQNLIDRIGFLIESSFIKLDFSENSDLALLLSEHFYFFRDNPIMAYSFIQTLLIYNLENLSISKLLDCYEVSQKYIEAMINYNFRLKSKSKLGRINEDKMAHDNLLETNFKETFLIYEKIQKIQEIMNNYCQVIIDVIKKRNIVEESVKFKKLEDTGEILSINFTYLTEDKMGEIIKMLKYETELNRNLNKEISDLKTSKFPMEFYYKIFLFWDTFMQSKIDEKLIPIFYSFTKDHNLYSTNINPNIFLLLRQRYIDLNKNEISLYYCIFKYSKGMTIYYFSEPLAQILGYLQSELIRSDIDILMPNEISKPHDNMMLHYLITKQNRVYEGIYNKFFNKKGLFIKGSMNGAALLGLGKNILVMINTRLIENDNEFELYYNQSLDLISFSHSFYNNFFMDLDLVSKCNLNLLTLFGINQDLIRKKLSEIKTYINDYRAYLEIMTEEIYSKKLYKPANKYNIVKYKLFEELENQNFEESENYHINNKLLKAQKCLEHIYNKLYKDKIHSLVLKFKRTKSLVLNNFDKFVNNNDKIDLNDKYYKLLLDSFYQFQSHFSQNKTIGNVGNNIYTILVDMHILYDIPFINIKIREEFDFSLIKNEIEKPIIQKKSNNSIKQNNKNVVFDTPMKQDSFSQLTKLTFNDSINSAGIQLRNINFEEKIKLSKNHFEQYIRHIVVLCILCVLIVYIIILIYQLNVIENIFNIFLAFYYNYIQRDKLVNLHSAICSGYYYYSDLLDYNKTIGFDYFDIFIQDMAKQYSNAYHTFYQNYIVYRFALGKDLSPFYIDYNFTKVHVSWDEYNTSNNYVDEMEVMIYQCTLSSLLDTFEGIKKDTELFFNCNFRSSLRRNLNSIFGQTLYYLSKNMQNNFMHFFQYIQDEIDEAQTNYSESSRSLSILIEVLGFILDLITLFSCIYFLKKSNVTLFKAIINLFIDFTQEGNYSFKNSYDNFLVSEKLTRMKFVMNNFSIKAIDKLNQKISYNTIINNKNELDEEDNNNISPSNTLKKQSDNSIKKKKSKVNKLATVNVENTKTNNISMTNSKSQIKLLNTLSVGLMTKLNQNETNEKSNRNISTKNSINNDNSTQNIKNNNIKKQEIDEENSLTREKIFEKLKIIEINTIKFCSYSCIGLIIILLVYSVIKLYQANEYFGKAKNLFEDYRIVTYEYSMIMNYFNNLEILLVNQPLGREDILNDMQKKVEEQFKKSEEVKKKSIKNYPIINKLFEDLNDEKNPDKILELLCQKQQTCLNIFDSDYNVVKKGVDVGLKSLAQEVNNFYKDFTLLKDKIKEIEDVKRYFINEDFIQIDISLNFLIAMVEDRCAEAFLEEANILINSFKTIIISLNVFIIIFLAIISISLIFLIINRITMLLNLIKKSSMRISISINFLKEKTVESKNKTMPL